MAAFSLVMFLGLLLARSATAFNYVADAGGTYWGIQDADPPRVDTGSIRATQVGAGQNAAYSTSINGFGGIRVAVQIASPPRFNGEVMRGFGLRFDGVDHFVTIQSVDMGGVAVFRSFYVNRSGKLGHV
jgi:amidase